MSNCVRIEDHLHAGVVDDQFLVFDIGILGRPRCGSEVRKSPSDNFMMLALWIAWIFLRLCFRAYSKAKRAIRVEAFSVMIFRLSTTPGTTVVFEPGVKVLGIFADKNHIHIFESRLHAVEVLHRAQVSVEIESLAQAYVDARRARRRQPVASGPFSATLFLRMDSTTPDCMKSAPRRSSSPRAAVGSQSMVTPAAWMIC